MGQKGENCKTDLEKEFQISQLPALAVCLSKQQVTTESDH